MTLRRTRTLGGAALSYSRCLASRHLRSEQHGSLDLLARPLPAGMPMPQMQHTIGASVFRFAFCTAAARVFEHSAPHVSDRPQWAFAAYAMPHTVH